MFKLFFQQQFQKFDCSSFSNVKICNFLLVSHYNKVNIFWDVAVGRTNQDI